MTKTSYSLISRSKQCLRTVDLLLIGIWWQTVPLGVNLVQQLLVLFPLVLQLSLDFIHLWVRYLLNLLKLHFTDGRLACSSTVLDRICNISQLLFRCHLAYLVLNFSDYFVWRLMAVPLFFLFFITLSILAWSLAPFFFRLSPFNLILLLLIAIVYQLLVMLHELYLLLAALEDLLSDVDMGASSLKDAWVLVKLVREQLILV